MTYAYGSCLCQQVKYRISGEPLSRGICYCYQCQKSSSAIGSPLVVLHQSQFDCYTGELSQFKTMSDRGSTVSRNFCKNCGTPVFSQISDIPDFITVKALTLEDFDNFKPDYLVWTKSAPAFCGFPEGVIAYGQSAPIGLLLGVK